MASKLNSEFNYRYQVIGETPWEKIKTLKGFLDGRIRAAALEKVSELKHAAMIAELKHSKEIGALEHVILRLEADLAEYESGLYIQKEAFELNQDEIKILNRLIAEEYALAEPTRIPGYTDEEMFEVNAANEFTMMIARDIQSEIIANGRPSAAKVRNAMSNPFTLAALQASGLLPKEASLLISNADPLKISVAAGDPSNYAMPKLLSLGKLN